MKNKTVLITGGSRGIGAACVMMFAQKGYQVVFTYIKSTQQSNTLVAQASQYGVRVKAYQCNVVDDAQVVELFDAIDSHGLNLTVLVNNVGVLKAQCPVVDMDAERINTILSTNVTSAFLCSKAFIKRVSTKYNGSGGAIINVSSAASRSGAPFEYIDYAASKGAMDVLTKGLSLEIAEEGIRVNSVRPGYIDTDIHTDGGDPNRVARLSKNIPLKRGGTPEEVAQAIYWLASDKSAFVTGSFIDIAGGL